MNILMLGQSRDLTDAQWVLLHPLMSEPERREDGRGRPWRDRREVLNGILFMTHRSAPVAGTEDDRSDREDSALADRPTEHLPTRVNGSCPRAAQQLSAICNLPPTKTVRARTVRQLSALSAISAYYRLATNSKLLPSLCSSGTLMIQSSATRAALYPPRQPGNRPASGVDKKS